MDKVTPFDIVKNICREAEQFDSKDRLLNFSTKGDFQTPLMLEAGDLFYEKWLQSGESLTLDNFIATNANFTDAQKNALEQRIKRALKEKQEDFLHSDLFLLLGFLKWDGNALAPSLLVPIHVDDKGNLNIKKNQVIENTVLRKRLENTIQLPKVEDAQINGNFNILLYFSLFEKAIANERNWKFTRHGFCLSFFNAHNLLLKKRLTEGLAQKEIESSAFISSLLSAEGFQFKESIFEETNFDQAFNPLEHHFLYLTDSHSTKVTIDALDENSKSYAIQTLPGTSKYKVAANIIADSIAKGKSTLVIGKRASSKELFFESFYQARPALEGLNREELLQELTPLRNSLANYFQTANQNIAPAGTILSNILAEFVANPAVKIKIPENTFQGVNELSFANYLKVKNALEEILYAYTEEEGIETRRAFENIKVHLLTPSQKNDIEQQLNAAALQVESLRPFIETIEKTGIFTAGIYLSGLIDLLSLIQNNFDEGTPVFEKWELRSNNWLSYQDSLMALPEAGDNWVRYRRQTSDIYTDNAVDENILSARDEFEDSLKATLKGLSDRYRNSRKKLLSVLKNPKSVSDEKLLDLIDTLIELQENKRAYKDTSVLGNHLLGKDWLYEKSNWVELNKKITFIFNFREKHKRNLQLDLLLQILENWHLLKGFLKDLKSIEENLKTLLISIRTITQELNLETPLESLSINKWLNEIQAWHKNWKRLDVHLKISQKLLEINETGCDELSKYVSSGEEIQKEIVNAFAHYWARSQVQAATKQCPDLFTLPPKERYKKGKLYRSKIEEFTQCNLKAIQEILNKNAELFQFKSSLDILLEKNAKKVDIVLLLDADITSVAESFPAVLQAQKTILLGDTKTPAIEHQLFDAYPVLQQKQSAFFVENILSTALRRGIPTRELWFSTLYIENDLPAFANEKIYQHGIKQLPRATREKAKNAPLKIEQDKISAIAKAAVLHAEKRPHQTLGILAFTQAQCFEIEKAIKKELENANAAVKFVANKNTQSPFYIKTPDRAIDKYRDIIFVAAEVEGYDKHSAAHKVAVCSTLAKQEVQIFISESDLQKQNSAKNNLFWEWLDYLRHKTEIAQPSINQGKSQVRTEAVELLKANQILVEECFAPVGIPVGPVVIDANNSKRFLGVVEDDCTTERFRESVEDRVYIRPTILKQQGWKVLNVWLPFWFMPEYDEKNNLIATIAIEQSVAPPPPANEENDEQPEEKTMDLNIVDYQVLHPKIEGSVHDKPIAELPILSIITQLKFYVDNEAPIHEELLLKRILELHHIDRAGPKIQQALTDAIKQGVQKKRFIKTGKFFYSIKNQNIVLKNRTSRPNSERKFAYVSPEERALLPATMDEFAIQQALGLLN